MITAYYKKFNINAVIYKITRYPIYAIKTSSKELQNRLINCIIYIVVFGLIFACYVYCLLRFASD